MEGALFLDRDGVINLEKGHYIYRLEDFEWVPGIMDSLKQVSAANKKIFIITNQGGIAKGIYNHCDVVTVHEYMLQSFRDNDVKIEDILYCPHHSDISGCLCRKPGSLLFEKVLAQYDIDTSKSIMIGDRQRDVESGEAVGIKGNLIESNQAIEEIVQNWLNG